MGRRISLRQAGVGVLLILVVATVWAWPRSQTAVVNDAPKPPRTVSWLRTEGGQIVDEQGRRILLRGFNDDALLDYRNAELCRPAPIDDRDAALMHQAGFNVVRLPVAWSALEPQRHHIDQRYLDRIRASVSVLERHQLRVVLDMHIEIAWGPTSEVPDWASVPAIPDDHWFPAPPWKYSLSPQVAAS